MPETPAKSNEERLLAIESDLKSLKGKGLIIATVTALLGSGGAAGITTNYWSARSTALQERVVASDTALKNMQTKYVSLQTEQQRQANQVQALELRAKKTKADQENFEARVQAHALAMDRLKKERLAASKVGNSRRTVEAEDSIRNEQEAIREFLRLHQRLVKEDRDLPGWYRVGLEQAFARLELRPQ